ncbi:hypothetical protein CPC08DRAFT_724041 [Agrocybe pediades]|nr:hypothetical protein CPC08DRAFT_724041 [Agrocybe pediades]
MAKQDTTHIPKASDPESSNEAPVTTANLDPMLERVERISKLLDAVNGELKSDPTLKDTGLFTKATEQLEEALVLSKRLRSMAKPTPSKKRWDVAAVSFSKVKASDYKRLGLFKTAACKIPSDEVFGSEGMRIKVPKRSSDTIRNITDLFASNRVAQSMKSALKNIGMSCGIVPEANARMIIDQLLLSILIYLNQKANIRLLVFTELCIAREPNSISIYHDIYATLVTGVVDYAVVKATYIPEDLIKPTLAASTLDKLLESDAWNLLASLDPTTKGSTTCEITWVEAKRDDLTDGLLEFLPQVSTQALAAKVKTGKACVPWCLTTGRRWIFGAVYSSEQYIANEHGKQNKTFILRLESVDLNIRDGDVTMTTTLSPIIQLLLSWELRTGLADVGFLKVLCDTQTIMDTFFNDLKNRIDRGEVPTADPMVEEVTEKTAALELK